jgi:hypothetical protein
MFNFLTALEGYISDMKDDLKDYAIDIQSWRYCQETTALSGLKDINFTHSSTSEEYHDAIEQVWINKKYVPSDYDLWFIEGLKQAKRLYKNSL